MKSQYNRITGMVGAFVRKRHGWIAAALLTVMFGLGLGAMLGNSGIVDEIAHIPAGYSYLHYGDFRLNPEHPPLMKDLAGLPLQFMDLKFPDNQPAWTTDVNGQWESGWNFIYHIGNDADQILFWSRLPLLLVAIGFGVFLYWFVRKRWGVSVALLTLFFYSFSPNLLAHSSLVTTDLGATVFMFLAIVTFARFVKAPTAQNVFLLSLGLAGAQLAKFSSILLYFFLGLITIVLVWTHREADVWTRIKQYVGGFIGGSALSVLWIWLFYIPHTWNMPAAVQDKLIAGSLVSDQLTGVVNFLSSMNNVEILKPLVQYILGLTMVFGRVAGGNVTYFNGQVTNQSFHGYFPELFVVKTQVALLALMVMAVAFVIWRIKIANKRVGLVDLFRKHFNEHILEWSLGSFAAFYFLISVAGNLNLGIRHVLPVYVPLFMLVAVVTVKRLRRLDTPRMKQVGAGVLAALMLWYAGSTVASYPNYVAYFNELIGGSVNADKYFSDSSVDWGQDLKRLKAYTDAHPEINHIAVDYFGGGVPEYYFCQRAFDDKGKLVATAAGYDCSNSIYEGWHSQYGRYPGQYIAVSETFLVNDQWYAALNGMEGYEYLRQMKPVAKVGYSIYVYKLY